MCNLLNTTMESKVTSKTSSLKALLLRAWRERWSDLQWGINIKTILPRGVSGDVHNLADCILQQALVGPGPNELVLSYLKHSLCSQLVSYAAVLQRISKYDAFHKPHCIVSLLEFLEIIHVGITCRGKPEEDLLAAACLSIVHWLLQCYHYSLSKAPQGNPLAPQPAELMEKPALLLKELLCSDFICAMLYSAKHDSKDLYVEIIKKCQEIEKEQAKSNIKCLVSIDDSLKKLSNLEIENVVSKFVKVDAEPITYCVQPLLAVQNLVNPSTETTTYICQLHLIQKLKNYSNARLYCELIRACMMCLHDVTGTFKESHWGGFTVLKLPQILKELHTSTLNGGNEIFEYSQDVVDAFDLLLRYTPLLDKMDIICVGNSVEFLLTELQKVNLVTEKQSNQISARRKDSLTSLQKFDREANTSSKSIRNIIIRAVPTLQGVLKTLNAEYVKIQDALLSMLCQVLNGNSFELMLSVATVEGKMKTFVSRLIKCNECSKQISDVSGKAANTRSLLFEISFLMLCSIVQTYGPDVALEEGGDSFFEQWVRECMPLKDRPKSSLKMLQNIDQVKVDVLLSQIKMGDADLKTGGTNTKWSVLCQSAMGVAKDLLYAWENGTLGAAEVKRALNGLRSSSCCLPVCAAAWLCTYMGTTHQDALLKPMNMVQQFLTPISNDESVDFLKERSSLMFQIIRKMQSEIHPPTQSKSKVITVSYGIISKYPILEQLQQIWQKIYQRGWIGIQTTQSLEFLLETGESLWFVSNLVKELIKIQYQEELDRSVDLIFAILHLDIENCTLVLINQVLPQYLYNAIQGKKLIEPQSSALAKLCVYCIFSCLEHNNNNPQQVNSRKRARKEDPDEMDIGMPAAKILRLNEATDTNSLFSSSCPQAEGTTNGQKCVVLREPLLGALNGLFMHFNFLAGRNGEVSQHTHFILQFLQLTVHCGKDRARVVLQKMPQTLVPNLLKALPEFFTTGLLLRLYDVQTVIGRKAIARDLCMLRNIQLKPTK